MTKVAALVALLLLMGCGGAAEDETAAPQPTRASEAPTERPQHAGEGAPRGEGTEIVLAGSEFGDMLYDTREQAIYVFELDERDRTRCYGECAEAWPPVYTDGAPVAGDGVDPDLLGTIERRDGRRQVTYAGRPLYFYAHEGPGEVRCHGVDLNGGLWWVVGADGEPLP